MKQVSGNPVKIDGTRPGPDEAETDAIAFDSAFAATVPVPNVLSLSETAARQAIATAGLTVGAVWHAVELRPPPGSSSSRTRPVAPWSPRIRQSTSSCHIPL